MTHIKGVKNKSTFSVTERLQKAGAEPTELQGAVRARKAKVKKLKREEKNEAQQVIMKAIEESGKTAKEVFVMIQRQ